MLRHENVGNDQSAGRGELFREFSEGRRSDRLLVICDWIFEIDWGWCNRFLYADFAGEASPDFPEKLENFDGWLPVNQLPET